MKMQMCRCADGCAAVQRCRGPKVQMCVQNGRLGIEEGGTSKKKVWVEVGTCT